MDYCLFYWTRTSARQTHPLFRTVEASTAYSQPSVTGTEKLSELNVKEKNIQIADQVIIDETEVKLLSARIPVFVMVPLFRVGSDWRKLPDR